jgi:hypothetical protein
MIPQKTARRLPTIVLRSLANQYLSPASGGARRVPASMEERNA